MAGISSADAATDAIPHCPRSPNPANHPKKNKTISALNSNG